MTRLIIAAAAIALLAGCREQAAGDRAAQNEAVNVAETAEAAAPLGAAVTGDEAKRVMHVRHEGMEDIGDATKVLSRELKSDSPDLAKVRENAGTIARLAPEATGWFPPGTGPDAGKTHAKPEIWQKPEDFAGKRDAFQKAAQAFNAAALGSDLAAIRDAFGELGKSCKACHDSYREKDD
jgi:cytochrome c556